MESIYLDHAATTPVRREVLEAMFPYFQRVFANPSSVHEAGAQAGSDLGQARSHIAHVLHALPEEIVFTSGGTESDNLAVVGAAEAARGRGNHVITSAIEHEAVLQSIKELQRRGFRVSLIAVDSTGLVDPEDVRKMVDDETILVSCMYANNEIGTIEPVAEIVGAVRDKNPDVLIHTDAVQAAGALPLEVDDLGVDLLSLSGHKIYGPRGVGVLYVRRGIELLPLTFGGGQEGGLRSGTENVAACVGMATALDLAESEREDESARLRPLRDALIRGMLGVSSSIRLTGHPERRLPGYASFCLTDRSAESVLVDLSARGIMCSTGSACHAGMTDPSYVLEAIGLTPQQARNGLRMTLGRDTTPDQVRRVIAVVSEVLEERLAPSYA